MDIYKKKDILNLNNIPLHVLTWTLLSIVCCIHFPKKICALDKVVFWGIIQKLQTFLSHNFAYFYTTHNICPCTIYDTGFCVEWLNPIPSLIQAKACGVN